MSSNVGETIKELITADNYIEARSKVTDEFMEMVKCCMPFQYEFISDKESAYQLVMEMIKEKGDVD